MTDPATTPPGFLKSLPTQPRLWDSSRLRIAMTCWRKHYYATIRGLRANSGSLHQEFGTFYHGAVEVYDRAILAGASLEEATLAGLRWLLEATWPLARCVDPAGCECPELCSNKCQRPGEVWGGELAECWQCSDPELIPSKRDPKKLIMNRKRCPHAKGPSPFMPISVWDNLAYLCTACGHEATHSRRYLPADPKKNRISLIRSFLVYADAPESVTPYQFPDGTPAVELLCRVPLPLSSPDGSPYELVALLDSLVTWEGELAVRERKTTGMGHTARYWSQFDLDPQIDTYDLIAFLLYSDVNNGMPIRVLVESMSIGAGFARLRRMPIRVPEGRREEWFEELQQIILEAEHRAQMLEEPAFNLQESHPRNTSACHGPFGDCQFAAVCQAAPDAREALLTENFVVDRWNPLKGEEL